MIDVLVLGGTGFLGRRVVAAARERGMEVATASRTQGIDLSRTIACAALLERVRPRCVVNCAAYTAGLHYLGERAAEVFDVNARIVLGVYQAVAHTAPDVVVVNPMANCAYPGASEVQREAEWEAGAVHPSVLPFASTRRLMHAASVSYNTQHGIRSVNWLVPNLYGPGGGTDPNRVHALNGIAIRMILAKRAGNEEFVLWGTGRARREWCYVDDAAALLVDRVDEQRLAPLNIALNQAYTMLEVTQMLASVVDYRGRIVLDTSKADGAPRKQLDDTLFRAEYPMHEFTPLADGIERMVRDYEERLPSHG